tara:strand:- start:2476 stop:3354 length:879 start_codon:yes stop_codon:yes gene_type:complete
MAELNFLEYNINPTETLVEDVTISLNALGFNKISVTKDARMSMWSSNKCILLVNTRDDIPTGLSGLGFNTPNAFNESKHCESTGMNFATFNGLNIYTYPVEMLKNTYDEYFTSIDTAGVDEALDYFAGVVINFSVINNINSVNDQLKLRTVKSSQDYITSVCDHNRFNILWDLKGSEGSIMPTLIIKTDNISDIVAKLVVKGFETTDVSISRMDQIKELYKEDTQQLLPPKHFIEGWQLNLSGKPKSYVLEKQFNNLLPNVNIILSERHNHNGINEESVIYYAKQQIDTVLG